MRLFLLSICFLIFINCQESEIRRPVNKNKKLFLKESAIRNKNRFEIEQELFKKFAENYNVKVYCWQHNEKYLDTNKASGNIHLLRKESITAVKSSQDIKDFFLN